MTRRLAALLAGLLAVAMLAPAAAASDDADLNVELEAGDLTVEWIDLAQPQDLAEPLAGNLGATLARPQALPNAEVVDQRGEASGWQLNLEVTDYSHDTDTGAPDLTVDGIDGPFAVTADAGSPDPVGGHPGADAELVAADSGEGMGVTTVDTSASVLNVAVPVGAIAGTYTSTATVSIISGPGEPDPDPADLTLSHAPQTDPVVVTNLEIDGTTVESSFILDEMETGSRTFPAMEGDTFAFDVEPEGSDAGVEPSISLVSGDADFTTVLNGDVLSVTGTLTNTSEFEIDGGEGAGGNGFGGLQPGMTSYVALVFVDAGTNDTYRLKLNDMGSSFEVEPNGELSPLVFGSQFEAEWSQAVHPPVQAFEDFVAAVETDTVAGDSTSTAFEFDTSGSGDWGLAGALVAAGPNFTEEVPGPTNTITIDVPGT